MEETPGPADEPLEWLKRARGNLVRAQQPLAGSYLEDLCFDAEQAAEKAIKAVLLRIGVPFPYTHDLARLLSMVETAGEQIPAEVREADALTVFATTTRYPGTYEPVETEEYDAAVATAISVVEWAERTVQRLRPQS
ncbi:MAG: hypothetical protein QOF51_2459 [Chloroflexota bacterium]|jgi:HEPN domain-containing protein|nr:hypothetical protein [Chloroflexota bacterium]